jgi:ribosome-associated protein
MARPPAETVVRLAAAAAQDKRAMDVAVLDVQALSSIADYFLICSARSTTQADTIAEAVRIVLREHGVTARHMEGSSASGWLLLDYGDVVVHVFLEETRGYYALDRLWGDAPIVAIEPREAGARD